jgi:ABC-type antimicrobial peptide transport system permease subunit
LDYWPQTPAPLASFLQNDIPQIEEYCRMGVYYGYQCAYLDYENTKFRNLSILPVDTSFFNMFGVSITRGDRQNPLSDDLSLIISESKAKLIFGNADPIGEVLKTPHDFSFRVTGVMKDIPENSSVRADFIVRFDVMQRTFGGNGPWTQIEEDWGSYQYATYFKLAVGSNPEAIAEKIAEKRDTPQMGYRLQPLREIHLYNFAGEPEGIKNVYLFSIIALLILGIACINHVNLVTARASKRSREIGIRKIVGAKKLNLFAYLIGETAIMLIAAMVVAIVFIVLALPYYNELAGKNMAFNLFDPSIAFIFIGVGLATLLLAGLYPAITLASFRPTDAFARNVKKGKSFFRKILVVTQFAASAALIVATIAISAQLRYMQNMNPGYNRENIFTVMLPGASSTQYRIIMERLSSEPAITGTSASNFNNMIAAGARGDVWRDKDGQAPNFGYSIVDHGFLSLMGIPIVEGENFREGGNMRSRGVILNETAARMIGEGESVIGMNLTFSGGDNEIVGVVKDFNFQNLHTEITPLVLHCVTEMQFTLYVKVASGKAKEAIASVEKVWKEYNADYDFEYQFLDETFDAMYKSDLRTGNLFTIFAIVAILISCMGLFGLVTYSAESKTKEIGIRKVLGASVSSIVMMLSKEYLVLVGIAMIIAFPAAYFLLERLLQDYAYRIDIGWWMFAGSALIVIVLTLLTVGWKAIKAATANPVIAIKTE